MQSLNSEVLYKSMDGDVESDYYFYPPIFTSPSIGENPYPKYNNDDYFMTQSLHNISAFSYIKESTSKFTDLLLSVLFQVQLIATTSANYAFETVTFLPCKIAESLKV